MTLTPPGVLDGSLYNVVDRLERDGFIQVVEVTKDGNRPERTIYGITEAGLSEMTDWLAELVSTPHKEWLHFEAALTLLPALPPEDIVELLDQRIVTLDIDLARHRADRQVFQADLGLPRLFALEHEYNGVLLAAERDFVAKLRDEIAEETLDGLNLWRGYHHQAPDDEP